MKQLQKKTFLLSAVAAGLALAMTGCAEQPRWQRAEGSVWNTTYSITYSSPRQLDDSIAACFGEVDRSLSVFNPESAISKINHGESCATDPHIDAVFAISQQVNAASGGMFDPTVAPLVDLWGFGTDRQRRARADEDPGGFSVEPWQVDSALALVGIGQCAVKERKMEKKHPATAFNFSAVAKGYGCDLVAAMFRRNGVENYMVEIGGEMALGGARPNRQPWTIAIDMPREGALPAEGYYATLKLTDCGVATSGNYRNYHTSASQGRFGHTISPLTGYPVQTAVVSATVIAPTAAEADAWATACMAMGMPAALEAVDAACGVEAMLILAPDLEAVVSDNFPESIMQK